jgi:hypothetical protein
MKRVEPLLIVMAVYTAGWLGGHFHSWLVTAGVMVVCAWAGWRSGGWEAR